MPPLTGIGGRFDRARANFLETFPLFVAVVVAAHLLQRHDSMTVLGAQLYFWARLVYVPLYVAGVAYVRTLTWTVSIVFVFCRTVLELSTRDAVLRTLLHQGLTAILLGCYIEFATRQLLRMFATLTP